MNILHIAGPDIDDYRRGQLVRMALLYRDLGFGQMLVVPHDTGPDTFPGLESVRRRPHRFKGLFDLKGLATLTKDVESFGPHIVQSHSPAALALVAGGLKNWGNRHVSFAGFPPGASLYLDRADAPALIDPALLTPLPRTTVPVFTIGTAAPHGLPEAFDMLLQALREIPGVRLDLCADPAGSTEAVALASRRKMQDRMDVRLWPGSARSFFASLDLYVVLPGLWPDVAVPGAWAADVPVLDGPASVMEWRKAVAQLVNEPDARTALIHQGRGERQAVATGPDAVAPYLRAYITLLDRHAA